MKSKTSIFLILTALFLLVFSFAFLALGGVASQGVAQVLKIPDQLVNLPKAKTVMPERIAADRYLPEVIILKKDMPDTTQLCAEPQTGGLVACRSVGEARKWLTEPRAMAK